MIIRLATFDDLPEIVGIYNEAVERRFATADLKRITIDQRITWLHEHDPDTFPVYVFDVGGSVRGWCSLSAYRPGRAALIETAEISYYVRGDSQRQGIGSALVQHAIKQAPSLGKRIFFGILLERNDPSIRLMQRCGFELWGRLPDVAKFDGDLVSHLYYGRRV